MTCTVCPAPAAEGDSLHLCPTHGGVVGGLDESRVGYWPEGAAA